MDKIRKVIMEGIKMSEAETEQQIKKEMSLRPKTDSFEIEAGSSARFGTKISLKCYYDALDIDDAEARVKNTLKIRQFLLDKQIM